MKILDINFENCYGIGKLEKQFDFTKSNTFLIYAPNGTMKTSLAKTFGYFSGDVKDAPCDKVYPARIPKFEIKVDGNDITKPEILVVNPESDSYDASDKISTFVASKELKKKYDEIYGELESQKKAFITKLKRTSQSNDCESEFVDTFRQSSKDNFFDLLCTASERLEEKQGIYTFRYNAVFDKKRNVKKFIEKNQSSLDQYISSYSSLLQNSAFFKASENSFGTYQANQLLDSIKDNSFFDAGHIFELGSNQKIDSADALKGIVTSEIEKIVNDPKLKSIFDKIDDAISKNEELREFSKVITKDNQLLIELNDYEGFRQKVWLSYLIQMKSDVVELNDFYRKQKVTLDEILKEAKGQVGIWKGLITTFNSRFYVPFEVSIVNQEDVVLRQESANLAFHYSDRKDASVEKDKEAIRSILSKGELRAYYILQLLFDIESRKISPIDTLLIFDDIADSFDYKNKYAIIEYLKDLHHSANFKVLILTHNFDFYRTVASRLYLDRKHAVLMANRNDGGKVVLSQGQYVKDVFNHLLGRVREPRVFISLIPFLRNLSEYTEGMEGGNYKLLTKCLHHKDGTDKIVASDIMSILLLGYKKCAGKTIPFADELIIDLINTTADEILAESANGVDEIPLENKIVLSIAIRLGAEKFMISELNPDLKLLEEIQTAELFEMYKKSGAADPEKLSIIDKVVLMTPENIHLNAFMYEPLIDVSIWHLISLYQDVKKIF